MLVEAKILVVCAAWNWLSTLDDLEVLWDTLKAATALINLVLLSDLFSGTIWLCNVLTWCSLDVVG